ncbi:MAG TPA: hypothetical protein VMY41_06985, partial [Thermohalobaculum sp.]|nr:hypothetical protein [Thermohalobaculum sp.]
YCSDESLEERPFVVRHQVPRQDNLQSQSYLESDTHPLGNPICQHRLITCPIATLFVDMRLNLGIKRMAPFHLKLPSGPLAGIGSNRSLAFLVLDDRSGS